MKQRILCQTCDFWDINETEEEAKLRRAERRSSSFEKRHPNDFRGRIISSIPAHRAFTPADTIGAGRAVVVLDVDHREIKAIKSGSVKIQDDKLIPVTFNDRWGAVAKTLRANIDDVEAVEQRAYACRQLDDEDIEMRRFNELSALAKKMLPKTKTHTGAGLYKVDASGLVIDDVIAAFNDNLAIQTEDLTTLWAPTNASVSPNATIAPDGTLTADKLIENTDIGLGHYIYNEHGHVYDGSSKYADAYFVKAAGRTWCMISVPTGRFVGGPACWFDLQNGVIGTETDCIGTIEAYPDGWYRCSIVATCDVPGVADSGGRLWIADADASNAYDGDGTSGIYVWGKQLEKSSVATSYKPKRAASDTQVTLADLDLSDADLFGAWLNSEVTGTPNDASAAGDDMSNVGVPVYGPLGEVVLDGDDYLYRAEADWGLTDEVGTITARIKRSVTGANHAIFASSRHVNNSYYLGFYVDTNDLLHMHVHINGITIADLKGSTVLAAGREYSVALASDGTQYFMYVDGQLETLSGTFGNGEWFADVISRASCTIGSLRMAVTTWYMNGTIKDVRYYDRPLTQQEVEAIYNGGDLTPAVEVGAVFIVDGTSYSVVQNGVGSVTVTGDATAESGDCTISPYSTIQSALDQLWTDQGSTTFTATQIIRVFAGSFDENVIPNAALNPDEQNGFQLVIEGDPADDRDNIIVTPTGGTEGFYINCDSLVVRHLKISSAVSGLIGVESYSGNSWLEVTDCNIAVDLVGVYGRNQVYVADCVIAVTSSSTNSFGLYSYNHRVTARRCRVTGNPASTGGIMGRGAGLDVYSCVIINCLVGVGDYNGGPGAASRVSNCTIWNCIDGISAASGTRSYEIVNNVFQTVTNVLTFYSVQPEWSGADVIGTLVTLLNNCFYDYTTFSVGGGTKTYAEFIALNRVTAVGNLDATDPLFTNPGTGDFSFPKTSKAYKGSHGAGVVKGENGALFDKSHPDIGAWASGEITGTPSIGSISSSGLSVTVNVVAGGGSPAVRARLCLPDGTAVDEAQRTDTGVIVLTATESGQHAVEIWGVNQQQEALTGPSNAQIIYVSATAVDTSPVNKLFDAVFYVLKNTASIAAVVSEANIRPNEDPSEPLTGNAIYYLWAGGKWDLKRKRGVGTIGLTVAAVKNHQEADELMDLVRETLTAKALTYAGSPVRVHLFAEDEAFVDTGTTASGRFEAATQFSVKFVEAS